MLETFWRKKAERHRNYVLEKSDIDYMPELVHNYCIVEYSFYPLLDECGK